MPLHDESLPFLRQWRYVKGFGAEGSNAGPSPFMPAGREARASSTYRTQGALYLSHRSLGSPRERPPSHGREVAL
jgi:hypothetical protein